MSLGRYRPTDFFVLAPVAAALCVGALPVIATIAQLAVPSDSAAWDHIRDHVLVRYSLNTLRLVLVVTAGAGAIGVGLAALVTFASFPGRRFLAAALVVPLAFPGYVLGFTYTGMTSYSGVLAALGADGFRSFWGLAFTLTIGLFPYVYLLAMQGFATVGRRYFEIALVHGRSPLVSLLRGAFPVTAPWIGVGLVLVSLETMADFGTVAVFSYDTLTVGVYKAWFGLFSLPTAMRLAAVLIAVATTLILAMSLLRRGRRFGSAGGHAAMTRYPLGWGASIGCVLFLIVTVGLPLLQLALWAVESWAAREELALLTGHTLAVGLVAAAAVSLCGFLAIAISRFYPSRWLAFLLKTPLLGYCLPGTVIATVIFALLGGHSPGFWGSMLLLVAGYYLRFLSLAVTTIAKASERLPATLEEQARLAGVSLRRYLWRTSFPLLRSGWLVALTLVVVEVVKEMPLTLIMRPLGWSTLATKVYELSSEGEWSLAAAPAIVIVMLCAVAVLAMDLGAMEERRHASPRQH